MWFGVEINYAPPGGTAGSFIDAARTQAIIEHIPPTFTDVLSGPNPNVPRLHDAIETGTEPAYAMRSATKKYRTTPLRGAWQHPPYFHDGSANDFLAVVNRYNTHLSLGLSNHQKSDLVEYLKSL